MTPEQLDLVATDRRALASKMSAVAAAFYGALLAQRPDLEPLFQLDDADRVSMFATRLEELLAALGNVDVLVERGAALRARHVRHRVPSSCDDAAGAAPFPPVGPSAVRAPVPTP